MKKQETVLFGNLYTDGKIVKDKTVTSKPRRVFISRGFWAVGNLPGLDLNGDCRDTPCTITLERAHLQFMCSSLYITRNSNSQIRGALLADGSLTTF